MCPYLTVITIANKNHMKFEVERRATARNDTPCLMAWPSCVSKHATIDRRNRDIDLRTDAVRKFLSDTRRYLAK